MVMTPRDILAEMKPLGRESYKRVLCQNHGVKEPCFGVPISELKKIQKRIKVDHPLALGLYDTGNYDAMYLAGLIADDARMTKQDLQHWADLAYVRVLAASTVAWVAAGSPHGREMALQWIDSDQDLVAVAGWATLGSLVAIKSDAELDLAELARLIARVQRTIRPAPDPVRHLMNLFLISVGCHVQPLTALALETGEKMGPVTAYLGDNDCRVPFAPDYIRKVEKRGALGKKRRTAKC